MRKAPLDGAGRGRNSGNCSPSSLARENPCPYNIQCLRRLIVKTHRFATGTSVAGGECRKCGRQHDRETTVCILRLPVDL